MFLLSLECSTFGPLKANWFKERKTMPWNDVVSCVVSFWVRSADRQVEQCDVWSWAVRSAIEKWWSKTPSGYSVCHIRMFEKHSSAYKMKECFTKQVIHTAVPKYLQPSLPHIIAEYLRKFALNSWPLIFCSEPMHAFPKRWVTCMERSRLHRKMYLCFE